MDFFIYIFIWHISPDDWLWLKCVCRRSLWESSAPALRSSRCRNTQSVTKTVCVFGVCVWERQRHTHTHTGVLIIWSLDIRNTVNVGKPLFTFAVIPLFSCIWFLDKHICEMNKCKYNTWKESRHFRCYNHISNVTVNKHLEYNIFIVHFCFETNFSLSFSHQSLHYLHSPTLCWILMLDAH